MDFLSLFKKTPDVYSKKLTGNIEKIYRLASDGLEEVRTTFETIDRYQDIDEARGAGLERLGRDVLQARDQMDDATYRLMIKTKIRSDLSAGDIETIIEISKVLLGDSLLRIQEMWCVTGHPSAGEPAALLILLDRKALRQIPYQALKRVVAGGVKLYFQVVDDTDRIEFSSDNQRFLISGHQICGTFSAGGEFEL